ncbi:MAG: hypothetical protein V3V10_06200 [Planctomycetota bacterium]
MKTNNKSAIKLCVALVIVVGVGLFFVFKNVEPDNKLSVRAADDESAQPANSAAAVQPIDRPPVNAEQPDDAPPEVVDLGLTTAEMYEALFKAIKVRDSYAAERLIKALRGSKEEDVIPMAKKHFTKYALGQSDSGLPAKSYYYCILSIFADKDPEFAFENVRNDWGKNGLDTGNLKRWESLELMPIDTLACSILTDAERMSALGLSYTIVQNLNSGKTQYLELLKWLNESYLTIVTAEEVPDPWLSQLVLVLGSYWDRYSDSTRITIAKFLKWIAESDMFSERLKEQVVNLLQASGLSEKLKLARSACR